MTKKSAKLEEVPEGEGINRVTLEKGGKYPTWIRLHPSCEERNERFAELQSRFGYTVKDRVPLLTPRSRCEQCNQVLDKVRADKELEKRDRLLALYARRMELHRRMNAPAQDSATAENSAQENLPAETLLGAEDTETAAPQSAVKKSARKRNGKSPKTPRRASA